MFQDGTQDGPIGLAESSQQLHFIFDRVTKKPLVERKTRLDFITTTVSPLENLIQLESICRKYMFDTASISLHQFIATSAYEDPPRALAFAVTCEPPSAIIAKSALSHFRDQMTSREVSPYFDQEVLRVHGYDPRKYSPAADNLSWPFVQMRLGVKAYYSYARALKTGSKGEGTWDWDRVADAFLREMRMTTPMLL
jgi:hypothetical protein